MPELSGSIERIVFHNSENGFCVARFQLAGQGRESSGQVTVVGTMPSIRPGEMLRLTGEWQVHPVHGRNFRVERFEQEMPGTLEGIERFLSSGAIRGIGPVTAGRIVERFGERSIEVIDNRPDLLRDVAGISSKRLKIIQDAWSEQKKIRELMLFLQNHEISVALARRIYDAYGDGAVEAIRADPYQLAHDVYGIGFRTADALAAHLGVSRRSTSRYVAGLKYTLSEATEDGHVYLPRPELLRRASRLLGARPEELEPALLELLRRRDAIADGENIYLAAFYRAEAGSARLLAALLTTPSALTLDRRFEPASAIRAAAGRQGLILAEKQMLAAERALREKVSILTGGPGTGKTSTLRTVIAALERAGITFCLCAPTGRAAKRVAEATGRPACTVHRLLEYQPGVGMFNYDQSRPLPYDFVIVDEVSMLDILLFYHLLKSVPPESHLLLVGDADQLPAVGPGNVLRDLVASQMVPTVTLTELFRQALGSQIVLAAHAVNRGETPDIANGPEDDLYFVRAGDDAQVVNAIKRLLKERIPSRYALDPIDDVQVIAPMHGGECGVAALNTHLQGLLNPPRPGQVELQRGTRALRVGDKVMQIRNNYDKDVYNGDVGKVIAADPEEQRLVVAFSSGSSSTAAEYESSDIEELVLAYAISVHKAQGSEFPCVVMPLVAHHFILLQRNLLYTALTRARQLCVLVGSHRALAVAAATDRGVRRNTDLGKRLKSPETETLQLELV